MRSRSCFRRVEVLGVLGSADPHGLAVAQNAGEPVDLAEQIAEAFLVICFSEEKLLLPAAVEAGGDGNGLAIARLEEFELAEVDGFADGVVDEGLGVGLLHRGHDLGEGDGDGRGDLGVEVVCAAVGKLDFAVDDVGICAGCGAVEGPLEFAEGEGQAAEGDVALGARVAQALRFGSEVRRHCGSKSGLSKSKASLSSSCRRRSSGREGRVERFAWADR